MREFQNAVDRTPWRTATFSADSEHVIGATAAKAQLQLYIWNRPLGNMERILEGECWVGERVSREETLKGVRKSGKRWCLHAQGKRVDKQK